ncbi:uncharacterized protein BDZ99DRAFT_461120 [Mytilinidion resinicola]|uniref:Uncharacterized protein n=1 Tax=Mytilinidion resinicola TaxID=574789 RepID=A0A6A6YWP3_9PEZI|nr:uncharacterized protein BDZ99DRAFT_461120 [Mytilinidion resinicola]KAF2812414.1 hypothetical protein BDZ99DRAFT_461120 [Mytilinidion resinicola]
MELHIPFFALITYPMPMPYIRDIPRRQCIDISFLTPQTSNPQPEPMIGISKSRFSLVICGSDNRRWIAYAFVDRDLDDEEMEEEDCSYEGFQEDPIICNTDANLPLWDLRDYFLRTLEERGKNVLEEWENLASAVESRINTYRYRHPDFFPHLGVQQERRTNNGKDCFDWILRVITLLSQLLEVLTATTQTWERFRDLDNGDIAYFYKSTSRGSLRSEFDFSERRAQLILRDIHNTFDTLKEIQRKLQLLKRSCEESARMYQLRRAQPSRWNLMDFIPTIPWNLMGFIPKTPRKLYGPETPIDERDHMETAWAPQYRRHG